MPIITVTLGPTSNEARHQLIAQLTEDAARITDIPADKFVVVIDEKSFEHLGVGGQQLSRIMG